MLFRFGYLDGDAVKESRHRNTFETEQTTGPQRLNIGAEEAHVALLYQLLQPLTPPYLLLYALHTSRCDSELGRYQSPPLEWNDLNAFFAEYCEFLTADGRHDLWIHSRRPDATLVWDRHNVVYAYGPLEEFRKILTERDFVEGPVTVPRPHVHLFHPEFDEAERKMVRHFDWIRSPLLPGD